MRSHVIRWLAVPALVAGAAFATPLVATTAYAQRRLGSRRTASSANRALSLASESLAAANTNPSGSRRVSARMDRARSHGWPFHAVTWNNLFHAVRETRSPCRNGGAAKKISAARTYAPPAANATLRSETFLAKSPPSGVILCSRRPGISREAMARLTRTLAPPRAHITAAQGPSTYH